ncbi:MAG: D-alanyl-D-alanine carboxypeptidase family protein [Patescibacteria group bacterium]
MKNKKTLFLLGIVLVIFAGSFFVADSENKEKTNSPKIHERKPKEVINDDLLIDRVKGVGTVDINAEAAYSIYFKDEDSQVLFSRNRNEQLPIASLTKLMTALVVYENYDLSDSIGIPDSKYFTDSHLNDLRVFTDTTFKELLYPLLLESNNSGAYAAATAPKNIDFDDFIELMNKKADELGMRRTKYYNPSGLDTVKGVNLSTARDVSKLMRELLDVSLFRDILQRKDYEIKSKKSDLHYSVTTTNRFLDGTYFSKKPDWYEDILGGKTGFTYQAMGCLVMVLEVEDGYVVNVVLGANGRNQRFEEMEKLTNWIYKAYEI